MQVLHDLNMTKIPTSTGKYQKQDQDHCCRLTAVSVSDYFHSIEHCHVQCNRKWITGSTPRQLLLLCSKS